MRREEVFLIGGGPSLKDFDFLKLVDRDTIVVNKSILHVPFPTYFVTVDYTFPKKIGERSFKQINTIKMFVADFSYPSLKEENGLIVDKRYNLTYHLDNFDKIIKSYKSDGIGYTFDDFRNGRNSGYCALQLAVVLEYKKIYLLGVDLNISNQSHYHGGYGESLEVFNNKLEEYYQSFKQGLLELQSHADIEVYSCSPTSRLNDIISYHSIEEVLK